MVLQVNQNSTAPPSASTPDGTVSFPIQVAGSFTSAIPQGTFVDRSGSVLVGSSAQQLMASNASRKALFIQNPPYAAGQNIATPESLWINFGATAGINDGVSIELPPGSVFNPTTVISTQSISVISVTSGHRYIAKEM